MTTSSSPERHPKVLFVTPCAFNQLTGGGITFSNLFRGWPKDRIATVHRNAVPVSTDVCSRFYRLRWDELTPTLPFSGGVLNRGRLSRSLESWIEAFEPDVIYTILGTVGYVDLVTALKKRFDIPVVIHLMDEGVTDPQIKGFLSPWIRALYGEAHRSALSKAAACLGICEKMSETYSRRFGMPFETFMNTVDMDRFPPRTQVKTQKPYRLVYTGSILPFSQEQSLRKIRAAVIRLHQQGVPIRLDIHTPLQFLGRSLKDLADPACVYLHEAIQDDDAYFKILQEADILVSPVNFDARSVHYIRYSMPTKIPSYLSSGTPILVYGPSNVAQVDYAERNHWGLVVNRQDPDQLQKAILTLVEDQALRKNLSQAAIAAARKNHHSAIVRKRFHQVLAQAAHG